MQSTDWTSFGPDLIIALASSVLTVMIALVTYKINVRIRENNALRSLIIDLSTRRALAQIKPIKVRKAKECPDYHRANSSILLAKDEVKRARNSIRPIPELELALRLMTKSCNIYLEDAERDPDRYQFHLMKLKNDLQINIETLHEHRQSVAVLVPGGNAFE